MMQMVVMMGMMKAHSLRMRMGMPKLQVLDLSHCHPMIVIVVILVAPIALHQLQ